MSFLRVSKIVIVIPIVIMVAFHTVPSAAFSWKSCSNSPENEVVEVQELKVTPDVISLDGSITLSLKINVKKDLKGPLRLQTDLEKNSGLLSGQSIPCQDKFGSCTFPDICSEFPKICPITAGLHDTPSYTLKIPPMSPFVRWMAEGQYTGKVTLDDGAGNNIACISLTADVVS